MQAVRRERDGDDYARREELSARMERSDVGKGALVVAGGAALGAGVGALSLQGSPQNADALGRALAPIGGAVAGVMLVAVGGVAVGAFGPQKWRGLGWGTAAVGGGLALAVFGWSLLNRAPASTQTAPTTAPTPTS